VLGGPPNRRSGIPVGTWVTPPTRLSRRPPRADSAEQGRRLAGAAPADPSSTQHLHTLEVPAHEAPWPIGAENDRLALDENIERRSVGQVQSRADLGRDDHPAQFIDLSDECAGHCVHLWGDFVRSKPCQTPAVPLVHTPQAARRLCRAVVGAVTEAQLVLRPTVTSRRVAAPGTNRLTQGWACATLSLTGVSPVAAPALAVSLDTDELAALCQRHGVRELSLFGSVLREDFTASSDVDVLVEFSPGSPVRSLFQFIEFKHALEDRVFHRDVDLVEKRTLSRYIAAEVLSTRRVIYVAPR